MTIDSIDDLAREAAADLNRRVEDVDTEAALADLHRTADGERHPIRRLVPSPRAVALVAAVLIVVAALAVAVGNLGGDDPAGSTTTPGETVDPTTYGPLLGTLHGIDDPDLTAEVYGPAELDDRSELGVSITGGLPGLGYAVTPCAVGDPDFYPVANCGPPQELTLGERRIGDGGDRGVERVRRRRRPLPQRLP